jgi:Domain of unknown function (DUF3854)
VNPHLRALLSPVYGGGRAPIHCADLDKSGISPALRREQGIRSVPPALFRPLGLDVPESVTSLLLFPYLAIAGAWTGHFQVKLFPAVTDGPRYLQPKGSGSHVYFVRRTLPAVLNPAVPLVVAEGAKKCLRATELGFVAVGIQGIENWHVKGTRRLLPDFDTIPLRGRDVRIVPDGDVRVNPRVERGAADLADALSARGAHAKIVLLPIGQKLDELVAA